MFIDEAEITVTAGKGGDGCVAYFNKLGGPSGGNGGRGANVYATVNHNIPNLKKFISQVSYKAEDGGKGGKNRRSGLDGKDLIIQVPRGTTIIDLANKREIELIESSENILLCRGGTGGLGNDALKSPTNRTPKRAKPGQPGEERQFKLILKLIADYGLIGLPNAGKSSLLNELTAANVKTAPYPFTTLEPNLGAYNGKVLADIPGLIEGASAGKGLGIKFLRHIEKVKLLLHCLSLESETIEKDYLTVKDELGSYNKNMLSKDEILLLTKTDLVSKQQIKKQIKKLEKYNRKILAVSIHDWDSLEQLRNLL